MQAILLCGGLGTRLRSVVSDCPKPLADIEGRPFMAYLCEELVRQGIDEIVFAAGYLGEMVEECFGDGSRYGFSASYAFEKEALGTGGAIRNALPHVKREQCFVLNADTYYRIRYAALFELMEEKELDMALFTREVEDISRYGEVRLSDGLLSAWNEKREGRQGKGEINGGVYLLRRSLMERIPEGKHSLENELIPRWIQEGVRIGAKKAEGYFIDIGLPESYRQFSEDVREGRISQ